MKRLFLAIFAYIKEQIDIFAEETAEALENGERLHFYKNILIGIMGVLVVVALVTGVCAIIYLSRRKILALIGTPLLLALMVASYFENKKDIQKTRSSNQERFVAELEAEDIYDFVRDAIFLVLRDVSEYTLSIKRPLSPSEIEAASRYEIRDGNIAVFKFTARTTGEVDTKQLIRDMDNVIKQKLRAGEFRNLPPRMLAINGKYYAPIQLLKITDISSYINIDVCMATERSAAYIDAQRFALRRPVGVAEDILGDDGF